MKAAPKNHVHKDTPLQSALVLQAQVEGKKVLYFRIPKGTKLIHLTADGRCLRRNDLESAPVPAEQIQFDRKETVSREFDREFVDGASVADLEAELLKVVAEQVGEGISIDKCLQYLGLAEYDAITGLRVRKAALLLFAKNPDRWHPRVQVRIIKVVGNKLGAGPEYNVKDDITVKTNIVTLLEDSWNALRPHLVATKFQEDARFRATYIYPEVACREALVNAIAHRDYSEEGRGIEIYVYDDRIEIKNPGALLSSISLSDIAALKGVHQSRNSYIARTLREIGVMRELGEGMRRIFELMRSNELAKPEITNEGATFGLTLHHRPMYAKDESLWLEQYDQFKLSAEEKAAILMGRKGDLLSANDIIRRIGIVDTEHYRQIVSSLQDKGVLETAVPKTRAQNQAKRLKIPLRDVPRFRIKNAKDAALPRGSRSHIKPAISASDKKLETISGESKALYVSNLPLNTNDRDLVRVFKDVGTVAAVFVPKNGKLSRGYAFVEFDEPEAAQKALQRSFSLAGRNLVIKWKRPRI